MSDFTVAPSVPADPNVTPVPVAAEPIAIKVTDKPVAEKVEKTEAKPEAKPEIESKDAKADADEDDKDDGEETKPTPKDFAALKRQRKRAEAAEAKAKPVVEKAALIQAAMDAGDVEKVLELSGVSAEKLVDLYIKYNTTGEKPAEEAKTEAKPDDELAKKLAALEEKLTKREQAETEAQVQQAIGRTVTELDGFVSKDPERYELASKAETVKDLTNGEYTNGARLAFDVMFEHFQNTGEYLTHEQAADAVEEHLFNAQLRKATPDLKARRALLGGLKAQSAESASAGKAAASPAVTGSEKPAGPRRLRDAVAAIPRPPRTVVTNDASAAAVVAGKRPFAFRDRLANLRAK